MTNKRPLAAIILAAGQGTRMKSDLHKVLHPVAGKPMLHHLLDKVDVLGAAKTVVVVGARSEQVEASVTDRRIAIAHQTRQLGTGHAVQMAAPALADFDGDVIILYGDVPLVRAETMAAMVARLNEAPQLAAVVLGFRPDDAAAYGRILTRGEGIIDKMVEYKDASAAERASDLCNSGLMCVRSADLFAMLDRVTSDNVAGEYYLPDIIGIAAQDGRESAVIEADAWEVAGVNSRTELAAVEASWQTRRRSEAMAQGATLIAPETVWFAYDTKVGRDVTIEPHVIFGPGVTLHDGATVHGFSHVSGAEIKRGAAAGPFARLRPGAVLEEDSKIGNFVEVKNTVLGKGAKAGHLTYLGDADVGADANIGAGTITCNYDGYFKHRTEIGEGAFIGSNTALVAPVRIGNGAIVGAGATVTADVSIDALALVRPEQTEKKGWAKRFREAMQAKKSKG